MIVMSGSVQIYEYYPLHLIAANWAVTCLIVELHRARRANKARVPPDTGLQGFTRHYV